MTEHQRILNIISNIRNSHSEMVNIFSYGSCMNFYVILKSIFPNAIAYYDSNHVITEINGKFYDITGRVIRKNHVKFTEFYSKRRTSRSFSQMMKAEYRIN